MTTTSTTIRNTGDLLDTMHRLPADVAGHAHFWTHNGRYGVSEWFDTNDKIARRRAFRALPAGDCYVSVNPSYRIPPHNKSGNTNPRFIAKQAEYIGAVNVFYAEFDGKDYVRPDEYAQFLPADYATLPEAKQRQMRKTAKECAFYFSPDEYKQRAYDAVLSMPLRPTVIVDSGGGYHTYFELSQTVLLDESNRGDVAMLQAHLVAYCGGDMGAHDISRVLRVPGTYNCKNGWGPNRPKVAIIAWNDDAIYDYGDIEAAVYDWLATQKLPAGEIEPVTNAVVSREHGTVRSMFNAQTSVVSLMTKRGYGKVHETKNKDGAVVMTRLGRPGKEKVPSVTVFPANESKPEIAVCWSGNDDLHGGTVTDAEGNVRQRGHDAYSILAHLYCNGDSKRAWIQAKKFLGLWG